MKGQDKIVRYCNGVTPVPRRDTALRPEFGGTRPGMPCDHALSPVSCAPSTELNLGQSVARRIYCGVLGCEPRVSFSV